LAKGSVFAISALALSVEGSGALGAACAKVADGAASAHARAMSAAEKDEGEAGKEEVIRRFCEATESLANAKYARSF